jgi:hypothetical protein
MHVGSVGLGRIGIELAHRLEGFKTTIGYFDSAPRDVPYLGYPDALTISQARPDFRQHDHPATVAASTRPSPARKPRASRFAWASIPDRRNNATSSRGVRVLLGRQMFQSPGPIARWGSLEAIRTPAAARRDSPNLLMYVGIYPTR